MKKRSHFLANCSVGGLVLSALGANAAAKAPDSSLTPNIVFFLMDDMGYGDCRAYNPDGKIELPHLEQLAKEGMLFTDAHSPSAVCAPTRYSVLTGNYPWRGRNVNGTWTFNAPSQLLEGQETVANLLGRAGYHTAFFGKMHLGGDIYSKEDGSPITDHYADFNTMDFSRPLGDGPMDMGFDYSYALPSGIQGFPYAFFENDMLVCDPDTLRFWKKGRHGESVIKFAGFGEPEWDSSQAGPKLTAKTLDFIDRHFAENKESGSRRPFYVHYCSESCHTPHTPPKELGGVPIKGVSGINGKLDILFEADVTLGKIIEKVRDAGELDNTIFIFTSDNGGLIWDNSRDHGHDSCAPLRGAKAEVWEGGHRVPMIVKWGDGTLEGSPIAPGSRSDAILGLQDLFATFAELTGQSVDKTQALDSRSFLSVLTGEEKSSHRQTMFIQANDEDKAGQRLYKIVRDGAWKLSTTVDVEPYELYNLDEDLAEENNRIEEPEQADRVRSMLAEMKRILNSQRSTPVIK